jgi:hypothetical protein
MILSGVNCSVKMSVWGYERNTDIEQKGTESVGGVECGGEEEDGDGEGG